MSYNGMPTELLFLRQFLSQLGPNYPQVAMLIGLLLVAIYRPDRIRLPLMFRISCLLLAVSMVVTPLSSAVINTMMTTSSNGMGRSSNPGEVALLYSLAQVVEPILVALSICLGLFALLPSSRGQASSGPRQHPLDP